MKFKGIFCSTTAATNEEYKKVLKGRNIRMIIMAGAGLLVMAAALAAEPVLVKALLFMLDLFILSYAAAFAYFKRKL